MVVAARTANKDNNKLIVNNQLVTPQLPFDYHAQQVNGFPELFVLLLLTFAACVCCIASCCSGTVVAVGPGKYDKDAEGGRKQLVVQKGDKVGQLKVVAVLEVNTTPMHMYPQSVM